MYFYYLPTLEYSTHIYLLVYLLVVHYKGTDTPIYRHTDIRDSLPSPPIYLTLPYSTLSRTPINSFFLSVTGRDHIPCERRANNKAVYSTCPYIHVHNIHIHGDNSAALRWPLVVSRQEAWPPREAGVRPSRHRDFLFSFFCLCLCLCPFIIVSFVTTVR